MRRLRLTKTTKIILAIAIVLLSTALGYLIWRVNQESKLSPGEGEAATCPGGCSWHTGLLMCVGAKGCRLNTGGCYDTEIDTQGFCCDKCTSTQTPAECKFYSAEAISKISGYTAADYYSCTNNVCQKCTPSDTETIFTYAECAILRDEANAGRNCSDGATYHWACDDRDDGKGYDLIEEACTPSGDETPTVDCGTAPTSAQLQAAGVSVKKPPSTVGPFPEDGKLVLYFKNLLADGTYRPKVTFEINSTDTSRDGLTYTYIPKAEEDRTATTFTVKEGETLILTDSDDNRNEGSPECAPTTNNPKYKSFGWIEPSGGVCGSGLLGPPTGGTQTALGKVSIYTFRNNAVTQGYTALTNGEQCWADWMEWPGDYDFNDYFLMVSYASAEISVAPNFTISKSVVESCMDEDSADPTAKLTYSIVVNNTGGGAGNITKIVDTLDSKVEDSFVQTDTITQSGSFSGGQVTWDFTSSPVSVAAGSTKTYTYSLLIDKENFDTYANEVTLYPEDSDAITATANITADCEIEEEVEEPETPEAPAVPQTGIFDTTLGKLAVGLFLIVVGGLVYIAPNISLSVYVRNGHMYIKDRNIGKIRKRFEKKVESK